MVVFSYVTNSNLHVIQHPLIQHSLGYLRSASTGLQEFRHHSDLICQLLFVEAIRSLSSLTTQIETPLGPAAAEQLSDEVVVVPVLRAGLAMLTGAMHVLPKARIGFVGLERDEETAVARRYYWKLPPITPQTVVVVTDPMLATGGSLAHLLGEVQPKQPKAMIVVSVVSAPEGVARLAAEFPSAEVYTAALDDRLNDRKFIVPGLGDYGDRYFGTE